MAVLISGDGDFEKALTLLRAWRKQLLVISTEGFIPRELRKIEGRHYIDIEDIKRKLKKFDHNKKSCL